MKKIFKYEFSATGLKVMGPAKSLGLKGTALTVDAHAIHYCFSNGFFPRR